MGSDARPLLIRMSPELEDEVRKLAEGDARSINWMVCGLVEAALKKQTRRADVVRRIVSGIGVGNAGYARQTP